MIDNRKGILAFTAPSPAFDDTCLPPPSSIGQFSRDSFLCR